jgi:hypothetical protein
VSGRLPDSSEIGRGSSTQAEVKAWVNATSTERTGGVYIGPSSSHRVVTFAMTTTRWPSASTAPTCTQPWGHYPEMARSRHWTPDQSSAREVAACSCSAGASTMSAGRTMLLWRWAA